MSRSQMPREAREPSIFVGVVSAGVGDTGTLGWRRSERRVGAGSEELESRCTHAALASCRTKGWMEEWGAWCNWEADVAGDPQRFVWVGGDPSPRAVRSTLE